MPEVPRRPAEGLGKTVLLQWMLRPCRAEEVTAIKGRNREGETGPLQAGTEAVRKVESRRHERTRYRPPTAGP